MQDRRRPRSYTYRIPLDDRRAVRKIHRLQSLDSGYMIHEIRRSQVPNGKAARHFACKFYKSTESRDFETDKMQGGTIPGLHDYRYSLEWEPTPETELLEMRHANGGGTKIKGEQFVGTHNPLLPDYAPVETTVPWTPNEIKAMFDGEPVPDRVNYTHEPPELEAKVARQRYRRMIEQAAFDGMDELEERLRKIQEVECDHDHAVKIEDSVGVVGFCEDCGKEWRDENEMDADEPRVVGLA